MICLTFCTPIISRFFSFGAAEFSGVLSIEDRSLRLQLAEFFLFTLFRSFHLELEKQ